MSSLTVAACLFCSGAFAAVVASVPTEHLDLDEQWLLTPTAAPCSSAAPRPRTLDEPAAANISWDVSAANDSGVVSVDSRTGLFGAVAVVDSLLTIEAPLRLRPADVACRITLPDGRQVALKERVPTAQTSLVGTADHLRLASYGEMGRECGRERCKSHGATCNSSSLGHSLLCACPTNKSAYDRFYDVCHKGRALHENCLFSEACSSADPNSLCVNGHVRVLRGPSVAGPGLLSSVGLVRRALWSCRGRLHGSGRCVWPRQGVRLRTGPRAPQRLVRHPA
ncbi:uncharacterized protein LOC125941971 [Dermacentor silvarum]|uniref:uncharacterized protein LOC125941971 n=1 Tax=Dermacentor silvarum TaxID=543639 RepID=UPI00210126A0|nr:uncharacterized protein LOC125941971 [Dermacentor silvarum]